MSNSGDAAEQIVRMSLEGVEIAAKITGDGAAKIAVMLYKVLKDQTRTKGKIRLTNMLRSGKELKVFSIDNENLTKFTQEAKKYGVLYCVLKDRDATDNATDIMVRAEDASKIKRIFERFNFTKIDLASIRSEIQRAKASRDETEAPETGSTRQRSIDEFLDDLNINQSAGEKPTKNPMKARVEKSSQSAPSFTPTKLSKNSIYSTGDYELFKRPSVRAEMEKIRAELQNEAARSIKAPVRMLEHIDPGKNKKKSKTKER